MIEFSRFLGNPIGHAMKGHRLPAFLWFQVRDLFLELLPLRLITKASLNARSSQRITWILCFPFWWHSGTHELVGTAK